MNHPPKYPSTPHWPWSQTVHKDDRYHQDPIAFVGREVVITEKLDGGNTCLYGGEVYARSTGQPSHHGWMGMVRKHHAWKTVDARPDMVFYGEDLFGIHSIEYDAMREDETFRLFAARYINPKYMEGGWFADHDLLEKIAAELGVITVPTLFKGTFDSVEDITEWFEAHIDQPSTLGGECEGFVIKRNTPIIADQFSHYVAKYVRANHVQTDEHWTRNWQQCRLKT